MKNTLLIVVALLPLAACNSGGEAAPDGAGRFVASSVGRIDSAQEARQLVASVDGVITDMFVQRGQSITAGQPLLKVECRAREDTAIATKAQAGQIDASRRLVQLGPRLEVRQRAEANALAAKAALVDASDKLQRAEALLAKGFVTQREIVSLQNTVEAARANLRARNADLDMARNGSRPEEVSGANYSLSAALANARQAESLADQCTMRSPIAGKVLQILRMPGEFSAASQGVPLIIVGDVGNLMVRAEVNERDAGKVRVGQKVEVWEDWQKHRWQGHVVSMANVMGRRTARSLDPTDRFDRDIREVFVTLDGRMPPDLIGLRVTVGFMP